MPFAFESDLPDWMTFTPGRVPIVLVAPHGGRRPSDAPIRDSIKVNDLYTAPLTRELAAQTGGYALINQTHDRNDLDLNRVSQVRTQATWFLDALVELLSSLAERHAALRVFFVHGWNVVQPVCDVGVGLRQRDGRLVKAGKGEPTLDVSFFSEVVLPFCDAARASRIDVAIGRRYAAADRNNFLQVFSARYVDDESPHIRRLAELAVTGRLNAVQLELGVGLRWPGAERERFVEVFRHTLGNSLPADSPTASAPSAGRLPVTHGETAPAGRARDFSRFNLPRAEPGAAASDCPALLPWDWEGGTTRLALHFHDARSGLGVMGGVEFDPAAPVHAGRLLLSLGGTQMVLFTGEDARGPAPERVRIGAFEWRREARGLAISYRGTLMRFSHPQAFIRLEDGLASSWIEPAEVELRLEFPAFLRERPARILPCRLHGRVRFPDRDDRVDAWGFVDVLQPHETDRLLPRHLLSLPFGPDLGVFLARAETPDGPRASGIVYDRETSHVLDPQDWRLDYVFAHGRPTGFSVSLPRLALDCRGETLTAIPIVRHTQQGPALAVTFGLSRTRWQGRTAYGIYEFSEYLKDAEARG